LLVKQEVETAAKWCELSTALTASRRVCFLKLTPSSFMTAHHLVRISELANDQQFPLWVRRFVETVRDQVAAEYLLAGFQLAAQFWPDYEFEAIRTCAEFPLQIVEEIGLQHDRLALTLWRKCGYRSGLGEVIRKSNWRRFNKDAACTYLYALVGVPLETWPAIRKQIPALEDLLLQTPHDRQPKLVSIISRWFSNCDEPVVIARSLPLAFELIRRMSAPPFALIGLLEVRDKENAAILVNAPARSFKALEEAGDRNNNDHLIYRSLSTLTRQLESFTVKAFVHAPKGLMRTAKILGGVREPVRIEVLKSCIASHLFKANLLTDDLKELCQHFHPVPARLKAWCSGEVKLSEGSLRRYRRVLAENLPAAQLHLIEESTLNRLKQGLPLDKITKDEEHALRLLGDVDENRRGLRKFLKAWWAGDRDYLARHPATIAWYRKHPSVSQQIWESGIPWNEAEHTFTIEIETNPLEILKLGTYTNTCLGIGGICSYSAVAALLDANKKVAYARNPSGRVVGRQLLAITDGDRLVCFNVYPLSASSAIKAAFRLYDQDLAKALGLSLHDSLSEDKYNVINVLSQYWWDDGVWENSKTNPSSWL
jgi:hypothetical protein